MDWDWDEFSRNALEGASLGFLRGPRRLKGVTSQAMPTLRELLAEKLAQQSRVQRRNPTMQSELADAASLGFWPRR